MIESKTAQYHRKFFIEHANFPPKVPEILIIFIIFFCQIIMCSSYVDICLVLLQVPKYFVLVQIFCARPKMYLHIVAVQGLLDLDGRNSQKYLHQTQANF